MARDILNPESEEAVREAVAAAADAESPLEIMGAGSRRGIGRPVNAERTLSLSYLAGVTLYEPAELVLTARTGTTLSDLRELLAGENQHLAFEPPDWGALFGGGADRATIGGIVAGNVSGSRRLRAGAVRDHLLGARVVTGRGDIIKTGGRVVKNVTGYDLCKLLAGSYGTLSVLTEVTLKVLPAPRKTRTILIFGQSAEQARTAMTAALNSPHDVSGASWLPRTTLRTVNVPSSRRWASATAPGSCGSQRSPSSPRPPAPMPPSPSHGGTRRPRSEPGSRSHPAPGVARRKAARRPIRRRARGTPRPTSPLCSTRES
jgi:glycolate oxidase FAD binding subunit